MDGEGRRWEHGKPDSGHTLREESSSFPSGYQPPREPQFGGEVWRIPPTSMLELGPA